MLTSTRSPRIRCTSFASPLARLAVVLAAALCAGATYTTVRAEFANPYGVAVIIGNKSYKNERVPEVSYAHRDADAFRRFVLEVLGFNPDNVIDLRDASQAEMEATFGNERSHQGRVWRYLHPRQGSDVVVFYSGHGVPGLKDKRGYLLPADADPDSAEINGFPIDLLYANLGKFEEAKSLQIYIDACFSGDSDRGMLVRSASPVFVQAALPEASGDKLTVLAAASGMEVASWDDEARHGLFTHHLMNALYGAGDADGDGQVTAAEAKAYLDDTMTLAARREFGRLQNASLNGVAGAVLVSAGDDGAFQTRPALDGDAVAVATGEAAAAQENPKAMEEESPEETGGEGAEALENALGLTRAQRVLVQRGLSALEFDAGPADGLFGRRTRTAIAGYQKAKEFAQTGYLDAEQAEALAALGEEAAPTTRVGEVFRDCPECPQMVVVPSGSYRMGSPSHEEGRDDDEGPVHEVRIGEPFAVGVYEVTRGQWSAFVSETGHYAGNSCGTYENGEWESRSGRSWSNPGYSQSDAHPVVCVNWDDARTYVEWLSRKTSEEYRLLSESEWEYVTRAGTRTSRYWGDSETGLCAHANGADRTLKERYSDWEWSVAACRDGAVHTSAAGVYEGNGFGLHDMHGNVWEWVQDCWNESYAGAPRDGSAWERGDCSKRVLRGGSWVNGPRYLRSANRSRYSTGNRYDYLGFRIARTLAP